MLVLAACAGAPEAGDSADAPRAANIRALRWVAPGADRVKALTEIPAPCLGAPPTAPPDLRSLMGELAFESPVLLGGASARMGLSCASCHRSGRDNANFFIEGVSGAAGTADVTNSLFSKVRGNGAFDPAPIPDLAARNGKQIKDRRSKEFRDKVHGLVVEEFDGLEPPAAVFDGLIAYLDGLDGDHCAPVPPAVPVTLFTDTSAIANALGIATAPGMSRDVSLLYIRIARERLERIYERFAGPALSGQREKLLALSQKLGREADALRSGGALSAGLSRSGAELMEELSEAEPHSLYDPGVLRAALAASR